MILITGGNTTFHSYIDSYCFRFKCKTFGMQFMDSDGSFINSYDVTCLENKTWSGLDLPCQCRIN